MGILDDAIREHLELKRRHGVPEDELQRQEDEALGPARRDVAQQPEEAEPAAGQTATAEAEHDAPKLDEPPAGMERAADFEPAVDFEPASETPPAEAPPADPTPMEPPPVEPPPVEPTPEEPTPEETFPAPEPAEAPVGEPGHDPDPDEDEQLAAELEEEDLDVLEDTPDFLQETPEHDRLWFEQKPPRDFDFD
jgi:hypothetical protein